MISCKPNNCEVLFLRWPINKFGKPRGIKINEKDNQDNRQSKK